MRRRPSNPTYSIASALMHPVTSPMKLLLLKPNSVTLKTTSVSTMIRLIILVTLTLLHASAASRVHRKQISDLTQILSPLEDPPCIPMKDSRADLCAGDYITIYANHDTNKIYAEISGCVNGDGSSCHSQVRGNRNPSTVTDDMTFQIFPVAKNLEPPKRASPIFWSPDNSWVVYLRDYRGLWLQTAPGTTAAGKMPNYSFDFMSADKYQSRLYPTAERFVLVRPDYHLNVFYLLRPSDGSLFWQFGKDRQGDLFLFDRPYMPTIDKINLALLHIDTVKPPSTGLNFYETFTDYTMDATSGRRELKPLDILMTGTAENLSPVDQSVSVSWARSISSANSWSIQNNVAVTPGLSFTVGIPVLTGTSMSISAQRPASVTWNNQGSGGNSTRLSVQNTINVPPYSKIYGWVAAEQGILEGIKFRIKYNRIFSPTPPLVASFWLNGAWNIFSYLDVKVCWSPTKSVFNGTLNVDADCSLLGLGFTNASWTQLDLSDARANVETPLETDARKLLHRSTAGIVTDSVDEGIKSNEEDLLEALVAQYLDEVPEMN